MTFICCISHCFKGFLIRCPPPTLSGVLFMCQPAVNVSASISCSTLLKHIRLWRAIPTTGKEATCQFPLFSFTLLWVFLFKGGPVGFEHIWKMAAAREWAQVTHLKANNNCLSPFLIVMAESDVFLCRGQQVHYIYLRLLGTSNVQTTVFLKNNCKRILEKVVLIWHLSGFKSNFQC